MLGEGFEAEARNVSLHEAQELVENLALNANNLIVVNCFLSWQCLYEFTDSFSDPL